MSTTKRRGNNQKGVNRYGKKPDIDKERLRTLLTGYNKRNIFEWDLMIELLANEDPPITLSRSVFGKYKKEFKIGTSVMNPMSRAEKDAVVLEELAKDPLNKLGPRSIKERIGMTGTHIERHIVRSVMKAHAPEAFQERHPASKELHRTILSSLGPDDEWSLDGHDKLNEAGFGIYGIRDKWSGKWLSARVVPSNRYAAVVGVIFLELVKEVGGVPLQVSSDRGSEIRDAYSFQQALRTYFAPDLMDQLIPAWRMLPSPRNITIERAWRPLFYKWGVTILHYWEKGPADGGYNSNLQLHRQTANWMWFPLVQADLDRYTSTCNAHRVRKQANKSLPSRGTPNVFYTIPHQFNGEKCLIPVDTEVVDSILETMEEGRDLMRYIDTDFEVLVEEAYAQIESPGINFENAWDIFRQLIDILDPAI
ncbi:hypothetical protein SISNIDRAFT_452364 [Sistotremastrum niveocremeum HHB9708]|uniref:Integrase core domain-containing protein n=1 Tax=Sistotremastrum niveocremeum HHB9708 TaxID=1314777 RepID=A0A164WHG9_9AGAM|nr:hypothetical protein SISNIDRAFT_452364 [Sistotremastrum niveocremeum HHB9708]